MSDGWGMLLVVGVCLWLAWLIWSGRESAPKNVRSRAMLADLQRQAAEKRRAERGD